MASCTVVSTVWLLLFILPIIAPWIAAMQKSAMVSGLTCRARASLFLAFSFTKNAASLFLHHLEDKADIR
jgi:hypothetical protein